MNSKPISNSLIIIGLSLGLIAAVCRISWASPRIKFDQIKFDAGRVIQGESVNHIFEFQNIGDENLIIKKVKAG